MSAYYILRAWSCGGLSKEEVNGVGANKGENGKGREGRAGRAIGAGLGGLGEYSKLEEGPVGVGSKRVT